MPAFGAVHSGNKSPLVLINIFAVSVHCSVHREILNRELVAFHCSQEDGEQLIDTKHPHFLHDGFSHSAVFHAAGLVAGAEDPFSRVEGPFRAHQLCLRKAASRSDSAGWGARGQVCPCGGVSALRNPFTCPGPIIQSSVEMHFPPLGLGQYSGHAWVTQQSQRDT